MHGLLVLSTLLLAAFCASASNPVVVCYFPSWARYRPAPYTYLPSHVPTEYCTHVIWTFISLKCSNKPCAATAEEKAQLDELRALKSERPELKVLASVGGATADKAFNETVETEGDIQDFAETCGKYVRDNGLDGIDVDWEFPVAEQREQFTELLKAIRHYLDEQSGGGYILSVALGAAKDTIEHAYDIGEISQVVDIANLMVYDLHGHWDQHLGLQSALYPQSDNHPVFSQDWVVKTYMEMGLDPAKATLGIPLYGRVFRMCTPEENELGDLNCGAGTDGPVSEKGILFYFEICDKLNDGGWTVVQDEKARVPYCYNGTDWVTYENEQSVAEKVEYLQSKGFAGAMVWDLSQDDFNDFCGHGKYPLLGRLARDLDVAPPSAPTTPAASPEPGSESPEGTDDVSTLSTTTKKRDDKTSDGGGGGENVHASSIVVGMALAVAASWSALWL